MKYFSKIKKAVLGTLVASSLLMVGAGLSACGDKDDGGNVVPQLYGFDVGEQTLTVEQYSLVFPTTVHVSDAEGTMYDVVVTVRDSKGNVVSTDEGNKFNAYDAGGYTITYSIETWDFTVVKTVNVLVNSAEETFEFEIECDTLVSVGDTVSVELSGSMSNPEYTMSVINTVTGEACETDGLTFVPTEIGEHTLRITVEADEGTATNEMQFYARAATQEGEVEVFGEDWRTVREFSSKYVAEEGTWTMATSVETGIKDINGEDGSFAVLETDAEYTHIYFNIREDRAYYRDLAMKGYTHVRFRIYVDSSTGRGKLFNWEHNSTNAWRTSLGNAKAGQWTEFYIPLTAGVAGTSDKKPGFVESYEYYQSTWILLLDNSVGSWNSNGREVDEEGNPISFKIYFDDVFAVKKTYETTINTTVNNDVYDLSTLLNRAWGTKVEDYTYSITKYTNYQTEKTELVNNAKLTTNDVDLSGTASAYGSYEIEYFINLPGADATLPYQRVWIDVMDPSMNAYAHPDLHNFASSRGMIWRYQDPTASVKANVDGTVTYTTAGSWGAGLQIAPAYEQSYYRGLFNSGYKALSFEVKLNVEGVDATAKTLPFELCTLAQGSSVAVLRDGETATLTVSLDKIITHYNKLKNVALGSDPDTDWFAEYVLFYVQYDNEAYEYNHTMLTFTVSNMQMVK